MNIDTVNKYRKRHPRCKTCIYANNDKYRNGWYCEAKRANHSGHLGDTITAGIFCAIYSPMLIDEGDNHE